MTKGCMSTVALYSLLRLICSTILLGSLVLLSTSLVQHDVLRMKRLHFAVIHHTGQQILSLIYVNIYIECFFVGIISCTFAIFFVILIVEWD